MASDVFDLESLAAYLHLDPAVVSKMAERGKLPGRKVGGQWRFAHAEIHHWLEERIGVWDDAELARLEGALERVAPSEFSLAELLPVEAVAVPLQARTKASVISAMCELAAGTGWLWDPEAMAESVRQREDLYPTALETGVALLHPRRPQAGILAQPLLALGITGQGIPFASGRGMTDVFFLLCSVEDRGHLQTLARLSRLIGTPGVMQSLREAADPVTARNVLIEAEGKLKGSG
jgi:nitrogen PTS system EIIA component